ncbi:carboxymuconolactone decarboxylase family protein [Haloglycomyces albus]|uniref:carboxymuconolactone decarboxylase family protein n=1 Tax=Haloglycomyces albus TaxID=526067 RepID=UPI00046D8C73|nr:carboxymuconolactone decarboxylase family protein [Haloglycomyces albus]
MTFYEHTYETAPEGAVKRMKGVERQLGFVPAAVARMATAPATLEGFQTMSALFETVSLEPIEREVVIMTVAVRYECRLCIAMHSAKLTKLEASDELIGALRNGNPLDDPRLEALRHFTLNAIDNHGHVDEPTMVAFDDHGYTPQQALEVVLGIAAYTLSTFANRMTDAPIDEPLRAFA